MNPADIVILAILLLSVLFGLWRGFVAEVLSLVCWIAAFWVAWMFGDAVAAWYGLWLHHPAARVIAGYLTCFLGVLVAGALIGWVLRKLIQASGLSGADRMLGMLFGLVRGVLLVVVIVLVLEFTPVPGAEWWRHSQLLPEFSQGASWLSAQLPPEASRVMQSGEQVLRAGQQALPKLPDVPISVPDLALPDANASTRTGAPNAKQA
ncbi:MAG TPA: CvpA family protein, partial [Rhodanobacteraceae bacterium]